MSLWTGLLHDQDVRAPTLPPRLHGHSQMVEYQLLDHRRHFHVLVDREFLQGRLRSCACQGRVVAYAGSQVDSPNRGILHYGHPQRHHHDRDPYSAYAFGVADTDGHVEAHRIMCPICSRMRVRFCFHVAA